MEEEVAAGTYTRELSKEERDELISALKRRWDEVGLI
jgi:hypothetical protein